MNLTRRTLFKYTAGAGALGLFTGTLTKEVEATTKNISPEATDLLVRVEEAMLKSMEPARWEVNDPLTRMTVFKSLNETIPSIDKISWFRVTCDVTNNTPKVIDKCMLSVRVELTTPLHKDNLAIEGVLAGAGTTFADIPDHDAQIDNVVKYLNHDDGVKYAPSYGANNIHTNRNALYAESRKYWLA